MLVLSATALILGCGNPAKREGWPTAQVSNVNDPVVKKLVIVFDSSGSMSSDNNIETAKKAVRTYVSALPDSVDVGVVIFGEKLIASIQATPISKDRTAVLNAVGKAKAGGGTPLTEAVNIAYNMLLAEAGSQKGPCEYHLAVVTDGVADNISTLAYAVNEILESSPVRIFTIGFKIGTDHTLNQPGKTRYVSADNEEELKKGLGQILAEKEE